MHVRNGHGVLTARTRHGLLGLCAATAPDWRGADRRHPVGRPEGGGRGHAVAGPDAELVAYGGRERFDVLPLLVATDGGVAALGYDGRRLRPNIVVGGVPGLEERSWPGKVLRIGAVVIGVESLRARCVTTIIDPDTGDLNPGCCAGSTACDGCVALNRRVVRGGEIRVGDPVEVAEEDVPKPERGGWIVGAPYLVP